MAIIILELLLGFLSLIAILVLTLLIYRAWRQHQNAKPLVISTLTGIDEGMFVTINGTEQWISIRGEERNNPVLLILHGGPAWSYRALTGTFRPWEKHFTIVHWERPGTGKTYGRKGREDSRGMTFNRMAEDGVELTKFLCQHLHTEKIILLAHSAGSIIGVLMVNRRPDLFYAYVGTGQICDMVSNENLSYNMALERAKKAGNKKVLKLLEQIGPLSYRNVKTWRVKLQCLMDNAPFEARWMQKIFLPTILVAPNYSLKDIYDFVSGMFFSATKLFEDQMAFDAEEVLQVKFEGQCLSSRASSM